MIGASTFTPGRAGRGRRFLLQNCHDRVYEPYGIAAHHPTLYIESSMGTGLVGKVYGGVIGRYEGKGPLDIDAEIEAARNAALATCRRAPNA
jgi:hypothetical protein